MWLIYCLFAVVVLYFPATELAGYVARETRLFETPPAVPIEDALLPLLCLAVIYAIIAGLSRSIERRVGAEKSAGSIKES